MQIPTIPDRNITCPSVQVNNMSIYKSYLFTLLLFLISLSYLPFVYAQDATVKTKVGNPSEDVNSTECNSPLPSGDIQQSIKDQFGITMNGFDQTHLQWAWEKFCGSANTKFNQLVKGSTIEAIAGLSQQIGCFKGTSVQLGQYQPKALFQFILTHELGHVIRNCHPRNIILYSKHIEAYNSEGAVSYYGGHAAACTGSDNLSEDYADMIAYYVNPEAGIATVKCAPNATPPNPYFVAKDKPAHHNVVKGVLDNQ